MICGQCKNQVKPSWFFRHLKAKRCTFLPWAKVVELKKEGREMAADRVAKDLMGIKPIPMTEEAKEKLRQYNQEHKEEIKERQKIKRMARRRTKEMLNNPRRRR